MQRLDAFSIFFVGRLQRIKLYRLVAQIFECESAESSVSGACADVFRTECSSLYVRIGKLSTRPGNAAIPGSVTVSRRKFMQQMGLLRQ